MKKLLKKIGRAFVTLSQESEKDLRQSVLLVDGSFILPHNFALLVRNVRKKFKKAHIGKCAIGLGFLTSENSTKDMLKAAILNYKRRQQTAKKIDFRDCIPLCRDNTFNQILWNSKQLREHVNFL